MATALLIDSYADERTIFKLLAVQITDDLQDVSDGEATTMIAAMTAACMDAMDRTR